MKKNLNQLLSNCLNRKTILSLGLLFFIFHTIQAQVVGTGDWSSLRLYGHAYNVNGFTDTEYDWIANHNFLFTTEKRHAYLVYGNPSTEYASTLVSAEIFSNNPITRSLFYWNASKIYYYIYESIGPAVDSNPSWVLDNFQTGAIIGRWNYNNGDFRNWWVNVPTDIINSTKHRGIFIDAVPNVAGALGSTALNYLHGMMDQLPGLVIYNGYFTTGNGGDLLAASETLEHADGVYVETFLRGTCDTPVKGKVLLDALLNVPADKYIIANFEPSSAWNSTDHKFGLAAYLVIANNRSFFRYYEGSYDTTSLTYWDSDFEQYIGAPSGPATVNGYIYTRTFENAQVTLNLSTKTSSIVWGPTLTNLALNGTARQSTTDFGGVASRAIDGDTNGAFSGNSVTHTAGNEANAYWQVDLGSNKNIGQIKIFDRTDTCCSSRLSNFAVIVVDADGNRNYIQNINSSPEPSITLNTGGVQGKIIRVRSNSANVSLALAEVEVYESIGAGTSLKASVNEFLDKPINEDGLSTILYPNPSSNDLFVGINSSENVKIDVLSLAGQVVLSKKVKGYGTTNIDLDTSELPVGVYIVRINQDGEITTKKFVKN